MGAEEKTYRTEIDRMAKTFFKFARCFYSIARVSSDSIDIIFGRRICLSVHQTVIRDRDERIN